MIFVLGKRREKVNIIKCISILGDDKHAVDDVRPSESKNRAE